MSDDNGGYNPLRMRNYYYYSQLLKSEEKRYSLCMWG